MSTVPAANHNDERFHKILYLLLKNGAEITKKAEEFMEQNPGLGTLVRTTQAEIDYEKNQPEVTRRTIM